MYTFALSLSRRKMENDVLLVVGKAILNSEMGVQVMMVRLGQSCTVMPYGARLCVWSHGVDGKTLRLVSLCGELLCQEGGAHIIYLRADTGD